MGSNEGTFKIVIASMTGHLGKKTSRVETVNCGEKRIYKRKGVKRMDTSTGDLLEVSNRKVLYEYLVLRPRSMTQLSVTRLLLTCVCQVKKVPRISGKRHEGNLGPFSWGSRSPGVRRGVSRRGEGCHTPQTPQFLGVERRPYTRSMGLGTLRTGLSVLERGSWTS